MMKASNPDSPGHDPIGSVEMPLADNERAMALRTEIADCGLVPAAKDRRETAPIALNEGADAASGAAVPYLPTHVEGGEHVAKIEVSEGSRIAHHPSIDCP
ncbi:MAG: hypothetical protein JJ901_10665 [Erythrobacter sp.]|uniref:hypothetical protein n=1 Tax=Erythrobacter sp. TaxID=1042 RepID=UPI001B0DFBC1|nr:hypothetical protein [Erythrobacter sp.]MBO6768744.1 hypothetical protein [Erythrobacter sp.]